VTDWYPCGTLLLLLDGACIEAQTPLTAGGVAEREEPAPERAEALPFVGAARA